MEANAAAGLDGGEEVPDRRPYCSDSGEIWSGGEGGEPDGPSRDALSREWGELWSTDLEPFSEEISGEMRFAGR